MTKLFDLTETVTIVTGAARGNGNAIAHGLAVAGATVIGVDIKFCNATESVKQIVGDVTSQNTIDFVANLIRSLKYKHLVLVNNAGITLPVEGQYPIEYWNKTIEINLTAPFRWVEAFRSIFCEIGSGSIINITSLAAELAFPNNPAYIASKGGLKMLSKYYAKALGPYGVRVNSVGPGYILTEMTRRSYEDEQIRRTRENHTLLGRWGLSSDLIGTCVYLASSASSYVTGQDIYVDGGWTANGLSS